MTAVQTLGGKQIVVAVTGSIAAVEVIRLIHALRRCGAVFDQLFWCPWWLVAPWASAVLLTLGSGPAVVHVG